MLERDVSKRLGASKSTMFRIGGTSALKSHSFFASLDWIALADLRLSPPLNLTMGVDAAAPGDTSLFDEGVGRMMMSLMMNIIIIIVMLTV